MRKKTLLISFLALALVFTGFGPFLNSSEIQAEETIEFGRVEWPGVTVKTEVARTILEELGYETDVTAAGQEVIFQGMSAGDIDLFMGVWLPTMEVTFTPHEEEGTIETITTNLEEALYTTYVPEYVYEAGVQSMDDLSDYAEEFDYEYYGLEPGNDGNQLIQEAKEDSTYDLADWELIESSEAGMLTEVERQTANEEWIAFHGWEPHYMNVLYDIKPLEDPENIWGEADRVDTAMREGYAEEQPNVYQLMSQIVVETEWQDEWILEYGHEGRDADEVAEEWVAENLEEIEFWLEDVTTADGEEDALEVLQESL